MAKVSNKDIYNQDDNLSMEDYLLGTNNNTINKKTQTYSLGSIFSLFYNFLGFNAFLFTTDTTTYPIGTPGCFFVFDEEDNLTNDFTESRKITFSATDTYNFNVAEYFGIVVNSGKFLFKLINLEDKNNFIFLKPSNFVLGGTGTTFDVDVLAESGLSNGSFVNYKRYLLVLEFAAGTFDPADYDLTDFTNTSGNPFVRQDALDLKLNISDYNDRFKGKYTSLVNLEAAHPTSNTGDYAIVDSGSGSDAIEYIFDEEEGWVQGNSVGSSTTDGLVEGSSNLYFTTARVLATILSGLSLATGGAIVSTDSILVAFGKIQKQIDDLTTSIGNKLDKVSTAGVERAYIINADGSQGTKATSEFKDVLEFANLAAFPATGETGKIYLALDTNKTYRWSGSVYVQIGGGGKRTWMLSFTGVLYFDGNSGSGNWSGLNATTGSTFGLLGGTTGTIFQTPVGTGGLPNAQSPARVIPYNCKIKSFHFRNGVSPFSAVSPANFRLRFHTHTPNGTTTLNNPVLQGEFDNTGFNMPANYVYPSSCFTNNNLTLQAGDVITPIMRGLQALTAGALISDFYLEFEEI